LKRSAGRSTPGSILSTRVTKPSKRIRLSVACWGKADYYSFAIVPKLAI
jgi:hypothetical protein